MHGSELGQPFLSTKLSDKYVGFSTHWSWSRELPSANNSGFFPLQTRTQLLSQRHTTLEETACRCGSVSGKDMQIQEPTAASQRVKRQGAAKRRLLCSHYRARVLGMRLRCRRSRCRRRRRSPQTRRHRRRQVRQLRRQPVQVKRERALEQRTRRRECL